MKPSVPVIPFLIQNPAFSCHRDMLFCGWVLGALHCRSEHGGSLGGLEIKVTGWRRGWGVPEILTCFMPTLGGRGIEGNSERGGGRLLRSYSKPTAIMLIYAGSWREADSSQPQHHLRLKRICLNTGNLQIIRR